MGFERAAFRCVSARRYRYTICVRSAMLDLATVYRIYRRIFLFFGRSHMVVTRPKSELSFSFNILGAFGRIFDSVFFRFFFRH